MASILIVMKTWQCTIGKYFKYETKNKIMGYSIDGEAALAHGPMDDGALAGQAQEKLHV